MDSWLNIAKKLQAGRKIRIKCCGNGASMLVSHGAKGYSAHCFRCGASVFEPHGDRSIQQIQQHKKEMNSHVDVELRLPDDYTTDVPPVFGVWWFKYGISPELAKQYGLGYSPSNHRLVVPVYGRGNELIALQLRSIDSWQRPKYINPTGPKVRAAVFYSDRIRDHWDTLIICEDVLSAIRVGRVHPAASILGTTFTDERVSKLAASCSIIYLWLDSDVAGQRGTRDAIRKFIMQGVRVYKISSEKDPKYYNNGEIINYINNATEIK